MIEFVYFNSQNIRLLYSDRFINVHPYFAHIAWKKIGGNLRSRVHAVPCPVPFTPTVSPVPTDLCGVDLDFGRVFDSVADQCISQIVSAGQQPHVFYSGGIDSVSIMVAILRNGNREFLDNLVVVCNQHSIDENPYFYDRFIKDRFQIVNTESFNINPDRCEHISIIDGEAGNQCMGSSIIFDLVRKGQFDLLDAPWNHRPNPAFTAAGQFWQDAAIESIRHAPVDIETVHDLFWWINYNFLFDEVLLRKLLVYTTDMTAEQRSRFYRNNIVRFYAHSDVQKWSLASTNLRRESLKTTTKYYPKRYIYEFDRNDLWYAQKREAPSYSQIFQDNNFFMNSIFAIDSKFNLVDLKDRSTRQMIKQWVMLD